MSCSKLLCFGFLITAFFSSNALAQNSWSRRADIPSARFGHTVETVSNKEGSKVYAIGGYNADAKDVSPVEEYDPETDTWSSGADIPTRRGYISSGVVGGKIYVIGGYNPGTVSVVEEYNPATDTWSARSLIPTARWGAGSATIQGKIYVIGGADGWPAKFISSTEVYNPVMDTWETKAPIPTVRWGMSCCVLNGKIYAIGGTGENAGIRVTVTTVEEYDPATDAWTTRSDMTQPRWGLTTAMVNGKIYAIGGGDRYPPSVCQTSVEEYDPVTDTWTAKSTMPAGRTAHAPSSATIDGKIYVIGGGGLTEYEAYSEVFVYDPLLETGIENNLINHSDFQLHQNYPNPVNPFTTISYFLPESGNVTLVVFNPAGQEIERLVHGYKTAGEHHLEWQPQGLPGGIYLYKLNGDGYSETKKLLIQN